MEHQDIEELNTVERYLCGKLSLQEQARFEEHFIACGECLDRLEAARDFRQALKFVAAEEAMRQQVYARAGVIGGLARALRQRKAVLLTGALLAVVTFSGIFVVREINRSRDELGQAKMASAQLQQRYEEARSAARSKEAELQQAEQKLADERRRHEETLRQERQARAQADAELNKLARPQTSIPVFALNTERVRSAAQDQAAPTNTITLPPSSGWIVLTLEQELAPEYESYEATVSTAGGRLIAKQSGLKPNAQDLLTIGLQSRPLQPGDYFLTLKGITKSGRAFPVARHALRVIRK